MSIELHGQWGVRVTVVFADGCSAFGWVNMPDGSRWEGDEEYARRYAHQLTTPVVMANAMRLDVVESKP